MSTHEYIRLNDLIKQGKMIESEVLDSIKEVIDKGQFVMSEQVFLLEKELAKRCSRQYCVSCGSGTEALFISLLALGLKKNSAVFVPDMTFIATAEAVMLAGGVPVLVDVQEDGNISPEQLEIEIAEILENGNLIPTGIIAVDLYGRSAEYLYLKEIARKNNLFLIEDASQSYGGQYRREPTCSFGICSTTSFYPSKPLGCYGEGGAIFTDDEELYNYMCSIREHGRQNDRYHFYRLGMNGRLDVMQAAILLIKLKYFDNELENRRRIASFYDEKIHKTFLFEGLKPYVVSTYAQYVIRLSGKNERQNLAQYMDEKGIETGIHYSLPLHLQPLFAHSGRCGKKYPIASKIADCSLSIPMSPYLDPFEIEYIVNIINMFKELNR